MHRHGLLVLFGVDAEHVVDACQHAVGELVKRDMIAGEQAKEVEAVLSAEADYGVAGLNHHVAMVTGQLETPGDDVNVLLRLTKPITVGDQKECWFIWILLSHEKTHDGMAKATEFGKLLDDEDVLRQALAATNDEELLSVYEKALDDEVHFGGHHVPPELVPSGRFAGGLINDIKRRLPYYISDYVDGLNSRSLASILFLYFACLAPAVAFGGLLSVKTNGEIGAIEMIVATAICGVVYALFSGQPLTILGSTGPVIIFMGILYDLCTRMEVPYLPTAACVALWTMVFLVILAVTDASCWIRYFTRFTDDTFAALIALIFIYEAVADVVHVFQDEHASAATALLSLNLALGTFLLAMSLKRFRMSPYLRRGVRDFLADFGPAIAIIALTVIAWMMPHVPLETLDVPEKVGTSTGRGWFVNPLDAPQWVWAASAIPALLVAVLLYLDQNITVRLVNAPQNKLKKGSGYHLDMLLVGLLVGLCGLLGLPWMVAATVRSLNHVRSLATVEQQHGKEVTTSVVETRVTALGVHLLIGASLIFLTALASIPMSVLFGLFLFMGVAAMSGNQFFERARLFVMDPAMYPPTHYLRVVPIRVVHGFTIIQGACLAVLWVVKTSALGILFPLFIALLVPVRMVMGRFFEPAHLALLDTEDED